MSATFVPRDPVIVVVIPRYTEHFGEINERQELSVDQAHALYTSLREALVEAGKI